MKFLPIGYHKTKVDKISIAWSKSIFVSLSNGLARIVSTNEDK